LLWFGLASAASAQTPVRIPLWPDGAPGFEARRNDPEEAKDWWCRNIHNPSVTRFDPPAGKSIGSSVVICPGGGHSQLVVGPEGDETARWFAQRGVTAFVLRYRLAREAGSPYQIEVHARQDGLRAMRMVRARATEWGLDPRRIGMLGFSAGGEVVSMVAYHPNEGDPKAPDPIDRISARPDWMAMVYPGPLGIPPELPTGLPKAFFLTAIDDNGPFATIVRLMQGHRGKGEPVEAHFLGAGGHGFNMGNRSTLQAVRTWPDRLAAWLEDTGTLARKP